jgi:NADPH2:quinone reductase
MRAVVVRNYGGPDSAEIIDVPIPTPGSGQVRVAVAAAAINPVDIATRDGSFTRLGAIPADQPEVGLGWDVSGTVDAAGSDVTGFAAGDFVIGLRDLLTAERGTFADYIVLDESAIAHAATSLDPVAAATLPLNGVTAVQALDLIDLQPGQTLLVTGAAGALGGYLVELAAARKLHVVAVASATDESAVLGFGARTFIPRSGDLNAAVRAEFPRGVDGAIDAAVLGAPTLATVRDEGRFVNVIPAIPVSSERGIDVRVQKVHAEAKHLAAVAELAAAGALTLRVADSYPIDEVVQANRAAEKSGLRGRVVLVS